MDRAAKQQTKIRLEMYEEILSPVFPGERLMVCLNPRLRQERARKREDLLCATEEILETIASAVRSPRSRLRGQEAINRRVGRDICRKKVDKDFRIKVTDDDIRWSRSNGRFARSRRRSSPCARSSSTAKTMCAGTFFCVCWRITWNGICDGGWRRCCSRRRIQPPRERCASLRFKRRRSPSARRPRPQASKRLRGSRCTASGPCWRISARSPSIRWPCRTPRITRSPCSPSQHPCRRRLSTCSESIRLDLLPVIWQVDFFYLPELQTD